MISSIFSVLFKISMQASILICVVMLIRIFIRKVPKMYSCFLWLLVLFRLLCPVFIESSFSLIPQISGEEEIIAIGENIRQNLSSLNSLTDSKISVINTDAPPMDKSVASKKVLLGDRDAYGKGRLTQKILITLWLIGIIGMAEFHIWQYIMTKRRVAMAVHSEKNVWQCEGVISPFVMGCFKPRIYLPYDLQGIEREHILKHEMKHIQHFDPQLRLLGIIALCLHWWNPLVWLAIHKMNQDREMFCDEAVLKNADLETRKEYSNTLLHFAMKQSGLEVTLSFGESNTENRIKHILKYHKPKVIVSGLLIALIVGCAFCFLTVPRIKDAAAMEDGIKTGIMKSKESIFNEDVFHAGRYAEGAVYYSYEADIIKGTEYNSVVTNEKEFADLVLKYLEVKNKEGLANFIKYPITVSIDGEQAVIYKAEEFVIAYDKIVNNVFRTAVLATDTRKLFMNQYGVMLGNGKIWYDKFDDSGCKIYAINNSTESSYHMEDAFKTSWTNETQHMRMSISERDMWYKKLLEDIPHAEECYEICGISYEDMDMNGTRDLILQLKLASGSITPDYYPGAYLCIYMNDDPVYLQAYDSSLYLGFLQVLHADVDHDGYQEIIYNIFTGGIGGAGSSEKAILKYKDHTLKRMQFPGVVLEQSSDGTDVGYEVKVLFGDEENEYKAVCDVLGKSTLFQAENAVDETGKKITPYLTEGEQAGANCRGYTEFSIIDRNGIEYLQAKEYLHGEGGINHCIGWATFSMDWDSNGNPSVFEFGVEELRRKE